MKILVDSSKTVTYRLYLDYCLTIQHGFFQKIRALILPRKSKHSWYIPDVGIFSSPEFIHLLKHQKEIQLWKSYPKLEAIVAEKLTEFPHSTKWSNNHKLQTILQKYAQKLITFIPQLKNQIQQIVLVPTVFGTTGSFQVQRTSKGAILYCQFLEKAPEYLPSTIMNACIVLLKNENDETGTFNDWRARQAVTDFLQEYSFVHKWMQLISGSKKKIPPTLQQLRYDQHPLTLESLEYYRSLGYPIQPVVELIDGRIKVQTEYIDDMQYLPRKVFEYLVLHRGRLVSFDELADVYWGASSDESSAYSMAKAIQKIRDTLHAHGIYQEIVKTVRKKGYYVQ